MPTRTAIAAAHPLSRRGGEPSPLLSIVQKTPQTGFEPAPPSRLPQQDDEVALPLSYYGVPWCLQAGSNRRPLPFQGSALPTELQRHLV